MKYLGIARTENGHVIMPDAFKPPPDGQTCEVIEVGGDILLMPSPLDRSRLEAIDRLSRASIDDHRKSLEGLAK